MLVHVKIKETNLIQTSGGMLFLEVGILFVIVVIVPFSEQTHQIIL